MRRSTSFVRLVAACGALGVPWCTAVADGTAAKVAIYGVRIEPSGTDAKESAGAGWGGGVRFNVSPDVLQHGLAFGVGFDIANLLNQTTVIVDPQTQLRVERTTSQDFLRFTLGMEAGPHGHGFFRPFVGADVALHVYTIGTTLVVPDDTDPSQSLTQHLPGGENKLAFGYDLAAGVDLQYRQYFVESGVRFLKSFNVPQQFGRTDARQIHPGYFQVFLGLGRTIW